MNTAAPQPDRSERQSDAKLHESLSIAYADPPYPGCADLYKGHRDYAGEVDHYQLVFDLDTGYDGWCLHTASTTLAVVIDALIREEVEGWRVMAWVKPFAAFKRNVSVAYAWEPIIVKAAWTLTLGYISCPLLHLGGRLPRRGRCIGSTRSPRQRRAPS